MIIATAVKIANVVPRKIELIFPTFPAMFSLRMFANSGDNRSRRPLLFIVKLPTTSRGRAIPAVSFTYMIQLILSKED
jgi:hypothetical protein